MNMPNMNCSLKNIYFDRSFSLLNLLIAFVDDGDSTAKNLKC